VSVASWTWRFLKSIALYARYAVLGLPIPRPLASVPIPKPYGRPGSVVARTGLRLYCAAVACIAFVEVPLVVSGLADSFPAYGAFSAVVLLTFGIVQVAGRLAFRAAAPSLKVTPELQAAQSLLCIGPLRGYLAAPIPAGPATIAEGVLVLPPSGDGWHLSLAHEESDGGGHIEFMKWPLDPAERRRAASGLRLAFLTAMTCHPDKHLPTPAARAAWMSEHLDKTHPAAQAYDVQVQEQSLLPGADAGYDSISYTHRFSATCRKKKTLSFECAIHGQLTSLDEEGTLVLDVRSTDYWPPGQQEGGDPHEFAAFLGRVSVTGSRIGSL
jgi:hypothetical protein